MSPPLWCFLESYRGFGTLKPQQLILVLKKVLWGPSKYKQSCRDLPLAFNVLYPFNNRKCTESYTELGVEKGARREDALIMTLRFFVLQTFGLISAL